MGRITVTDIMPDLDGHVIDGGRLQLLESLGSGAYGKVYRAVDITSPRHNRAFYAVKCLLRPAPGSNQEEFQNREFTLHSLVCDHPNIVTLHRVIYDREFVYVVLDLCTGGDLFSAIIETRVFQNNVQLIKHSFIQLIDAVHYCHEKSVFHRDLKPENVLCVNDGCDIRLADFGLSIQNHVSKDFGCGSSYYMSPGLPCYSVLSTLIDVSHYCRMYWQGILGWQVFYSPQRRLVSWSHSNEHDIWSQSMALRNCQG